MNRFIDDLFEIMISIIGAAVFAAFLYMFNLVTLKHIFAFIIPIIIIISITMLIINRYRKIGLWNWCKHKDITRKARGILSKATNRVDIVFPENMYNFQMNGKLVQYVQNLTSRNVTVRILIPKPDSEATQYCVADNPIINQMVTVLLSALVNEKTKHNDMLLQRNIQIGVYNSPLNFSAIFVDNKAAIVDLYAGSYMENHPCLTVKAVNNKQTYFDAFYSAFNIVWNNSRKIFTIHDVNRIIQESVKRKNNGIIIAITGPSGAGKTTVAKKIIEKSRGTLSSIKTYTTRPIREGQEDNKQYIFVSRDDYNKKYNQHEFVISADFCENKYGVTYADVYDVIDARKDLLLDTIADPLDLKNSFGNRVVIIYLTAPTNSIMADRIKARGTSNEDLRKRLDNAKSQLSNVKNCDYIVINNEIDESVALINKIIDEVKKEYIATGNLIAESVVQYSSNEVIESDLLPYDEVIL